MTIDYEKAHSLYISTNEQMEDIQRELESEIKEVKKMKQQNKTNTTKQ